MYKQQTDLSEALLLFIIEVFSFDPLSSGNTALCPRIQMERSGGFPNGWTMAASIVKERRIHVLPAMAQDASREASFRDSVDIK